MEQNIAKEQLKAYIQSNVILKFNWLISTENEKGKYETHQQLFLSNKDGSLTNLSQLVAEALYDATINEENYPIHIRYIKESNCFVSLTNTFGIAILLSKLLFPEGNVHLSFEKWMQA